MGMSSTSFGTGKKGERVNDEEREVSPERRRSSRIVALEEKRKKEKERKLALASAKKQKINETKIREKGKSVVDAENDHLVDIIEGEKLGPFKEKGWKDRAFYQLINIFKAIQEGRPTNDESASLVTNVSSLNGVPEKKVMESVLDSLQRKDSDELFGEPISFNKDENCEVNLIEPMDFGTMRAKVHDNIYTTLQQFKRDVYLICFNAMNAYPSTSRHYKVAKDIGCNAIKIFESLSADPQVCFSKKPAGSERKQAGTPRLVKPSTKPKPTGTNATRCKPPKTDKRAMYQPPSNSSQVSEVLISTNKSSLELNSICTSSYRDSLLRFVKHLGPTAQSVAAKKLEEAFNSQQLQHTNTSNPNFLENVLAPQITHQLTPQALQQPITHNTSQFTHQLTPQALQQPITHNTSQITHQFTPQALEQLITDNTCQKAFPPLQISPKPLAIRDIATHQSRNANNIIPSNFNTIPSIVNIRNNTCIPSNVNTRNNTDKGKSLFINDNSQSYAAAALLYNSVYNTDEKGENKIGCESSNARGTMDTASYYALNGNMASRVENVFNHIRHPNTSAMENSAASFTNVPIYAHPSQVIPILRPQLQSNPSRSFQSPPQRSYISTMNSSRLGVMPQPRPQNSMLGVMPQPRPQNSMPSIVDNSNLINSSLVYPMGYSRPMNSMVGMNMPSSGNLLNSQAANQFSNEPAESPLFSLKTPYHPGDFQALMNSPEFNNNNSRRMQVSRQINQLGPDSSWESNINSHPMQVNYQMMNLIRPSSSSTSQIPFLNGGMNYHRGGDARETSSQVWDNDEGGTNLNLNL